MHLTWPFHLLGTEPSLSRLPCLFIICIFLTLSANESDLVMVTCSSTSTGLTAFPFDVGGRLSVNDSSTASRFVAVCRLLTGSWRLTTTSSVVFSGALLPRWASSKSGVDDHEEGRWRMRIGAVISTTLLLSFDDRFWVDVQLRVDLSSGSRLRVGVDDAMSSFRRAPCSL